VRRTVARGGEAERVGKYLILNAENSGKRRRISSFSPTSTRRGLAAVLGQGLKEDGKQ
jgi:hypothetical protein